MSDIGRQGAPVLTNAFTKQSIRAHQCNAIHRSIASHFKYALVTGKSSKFNPRSHRVGLNHAVCDEDVCAIFTN